VTAPDCPHNHCILAAGHDGLHLGPGPDQLFPKPQPPARTVAQLETELHQLLEIWGNRAMLLRGQAPISSNPTDLHAHESRLRTCARELGDLLRGPDQR
jgi:hypothetical protein